MNKLSREDLYSLEQYAEIRPQFRADIMAYKKNRQLALGDNARLYFESRTTIQYQIQEVLRVEKTFDGAGIEEELAVYNPLIPDGNNLKATCIRILIFVNKRLLSYEGLNIKFGCRLRIARKCLLLPMKTLQETTGRELRRYILCVLNYHQA